MSFESRASMVFGAFRQALSWVLVFVALALGSGVAMAASVPAEIDASRPVQDLTQSLTPIVAPDPSDDSGHIAPPERRTLAIDRSLAGWLALTLQNISSKPIDRILVFSYPSLARSGISGVGFDHPRLTDTRAVDGDLPVPSQMAQGNNRFAAVRVRLEPNASHTYAFLIDDGSPAISLRAWDPGALARFDDFVLIAIGLFCGILFVGIALLLAMRVLSGGPGLVSGAVFALAALAFEVTSFASGGAPVLPQLSFDLAGVLRLVTLVLVGVFGLQFLRHVLSMRDEAPISDLLLRIVQFALLFAIPLIFWASVGPIAARLAIVVALVVSGIAVWHARVAVPDALDLIPPGWILLALAGATALTVAISGFNGGGPITTLLVHGLFVVGVMVLLFSAAVRATLPSNVVEYAGAPPTPTYARDGSNLPVPAASLPAVRGTHGEGGYQGLWDWSLSDDRLYVSPSVERMMGLEEGAMKGKERNWLTHIVDEDRKLYADTLNHYIAQGSSSFALEFRVHHEDGGIRWLQLRATGLAGEDGMATRVIGIITDITAAKVAEQKLVHDALHDPLTGIGNRAFLISHLDWALALRRDQPVIDPVTDKPFNPALIVLDIERFKWVNSELGRAMGDRLLKQIARRIDKSLGPHDTLARIGSDEFAILLTPRPADDERPCEMEDPADIVALLSDLFGEPVELGDEMVRPSASIAYVEIDEHYARAPDVLAEAELALGRAKLRQGRQTLPASTAQALPSPASRSGTPRDIAAPAPKSEARQAQRPAVAPAETVSPLEADLRNAIQRDQVKIAYQPIMSLADRSLVGFEALMRWQHPQRGEISPDEFIPVAERTGLIVTLGRFALSMAAMQLAQWQTFFPLKRPLFVAVNVSSRQLLGEDFARDVSDVLASVKLAPGSLKLEMTETLVFEDQEHVARLLDLIKSKGVSIALDDYGQGHSNLNRLKALPLSTVKIDREFVKGAGDKGRADAILRSTISMAHEMMLDVVGEGVEKEAEAQALMRFGCDFAQGHLFGSAMNPQDAQRFIALHWKVDTPKFARKASA